MSSDLTRSTIRTSMLIPKLFFAHVQKLFKPSLFQLRFPHVLHVSDPLDSRLPMTDQFFTDSVPPTTASGLSESPTRHSDATKRSTTGRSTRETGSITSRPIATGWSRSTAGLNDSTSRSTASGSLISTPQASNVTGPWPWVSLSPATHSTVTINPSSMLQRAPLHG